MSDITLTAGQQAAYAAIISFLLTKGEKHFVLSGYAGTGKSTLVTRVLDDLPATMKTAKLLNKQDFDDWDVQLTATTNKAAEALSNITGMEVKTIQSFLSLRPKKDWNTGKTNLVATKNAEIKEKVILIVDEASYVDKQLLELINKWTDNCKIIYIGDPAQLAPVNSSATPVFNAGYPGAKLTEIVRQADGNPIIELATGFRNVVNGHDYFNFKPDGITVTHLPRDKFEQNIMAEFSRPDWGHNDSKVLAWTNATVIGYNHGIRNQVQGEPNLQVGDYAIVNNYVSKGKATLKTDQMVRITGIWETEQLGVKGTDVQIDNGYTFFFPCSIAARKERFKQAKAEDDISTQAKIEGQWIDLRAAYACTINKSQGSTYRKAFIDLDDVGRCTNPNTLARMMYVAVSRASEQVFLTGDLA